MGMALRIIESRIPSRCGDGYRLEHRMETDCSLPQGELSAEERDHRTRFEPLGTGRDPDYREYLAVQFERSLSKRHQRPERRTSVLLDHLIEAGGLVRDASVLCIGPRDTFELDAFNERGFTRVTGIDLFSCRSDILVMDMHHMHFNDDSFHAIYASHALEHAFDVNRAVAEITRVAKHGAIVGIEVPVKYRTRGADRHDFGNPEGIHGLLGSCIHEVLWTDEQPPHSPANGSGTAVARTVFRVAKPTVHR